jgi:hypothetical protein
MAYIGRSVEIGMFEKQVLTADSSTTTFTLTFAVGSANSLLVVYGGVIQEPAVAYSVSGGGQQIVFSEAPATGTTTYIIYLGKQLTTPRAAGQETTKQTFAGDGSTVTYTLTDPPVVPAGIMVFVDGILQREGSGNNYVSSGSTISFSSAPDSSAEIDVYTLVKEKVSIDTVADGSITRAKLAQSAPYWDGAGNVGIGVATPYRQFQVGNYSANAVMALGSSPTGTGTFVFSTSDSAPGRYVGTIDYNHTSNYLAFTTNASERVRIDSSGNVGIGTASASQKLEVAGNIYVNTSGNPYLQLKTSGAGNNPYIRMQADTNYWDIQSTFSNANDELYFMYNGSAKMVLDPTTGNVGIGTTAPSSKLQVLGTTNSGYATSNAITSGGSAISNSSALWSGSSLRLTANFGGAVAFTGRASELVFGADNGNFGSGGGFSQANLGAITAISENGNAVGLASSMLFYTSVGNNINERMRITSAGELLVGYTNAGSGGKLVVNGITYQNQTANGTSGSPVVSGGYLIGPNDPNIYAGIRALNSYLSNNASQLAFYVTNSTGSAYEAGRFDKDGNLLVGNTSAGDGKLRISASANAYNILKIDDQGSTTGNYVQFLNSAGAQAGAINHSGTTSVSYNSGSDYRLKNITGPVTNASSFINSLKPKIGTWKEDGSKFVGFLAHEFAEICPQAVQGEKDAVDADGNPLYQSMEASNPEVIANIVSLLQELKAIVDAQAVEIAALKAK